MSPVVGRCATGSKLALAVRMLTVVLVGNNGAGICVCTRCAIFRGRGRAGSAD